MKPILYSLIGGLLMAFLLAFVVYYAALLISKVSAVSGKTLPRAPEIVTFNLEKFNELKITP